ncbi:hypothetical protein [Actinokineospora globicatena]|uniref:hypothetical protein n=1 Tax=Actinokineospora globicatena TaxID=103729 RepID=UPI0020A2CD4A|nr:hypothetical protein [Actinokineospora globicatena]MCP2301752.1 hypothetical protein [Actinokineospora globicatena]GLW76590.1 hypothetical protein Aglo01_10720 [Actinokineospora globicatena]GLW83424.1 hypothetical protein Aglo02_10640 [Actinokineospora globicatena]
MTTTENKLDFYQPENVNTGTGDQYNQTFNNFAPNEPRRQWFIAADEIRRRARTFIVPPGYPTNPFARSRTIVLVGTSEAGTRTAAFMVLTDKGTDHLDTLRVVDDRTDENGRALDPDELHDGERFLLDLCDSGDDRVAALRSELEAYQAVAAAKGATLVVIVHPDQVRHLPDSLAAVRVDIGRPDGTAVLRTHLAVEGIELPAELPRVHRLAHCLKSDSVGHIAELARYAVKARDLEPWKTVTDWLREAVAARLDRAAQAQKLFSGEQHAAQRALLVAAAFLPGAPIDTLVWAESALHNMIKVSPAEPHVLGGTHLAERMAAAHLRVAGHRTVEFTDVALDTALRGHFWTYFPTLRQEMVVWVRDVAISSHLSDQAAAGLADRFAEAQLSSGPAVPLWNLARWWAREGSRPELARRVMAAGLRDARWSMEFRRFVYLRSLESDRDAELARVLIDMCTQEIAPNQPTQAMVRLHHFARHTDAAVAAAAHKALIDLVLAQGYVLWLLDRLSTKEMDSVNLAILLALDLRSDQVGHRTRRDLSVLWQRMFADSTRVVEPGVLWEWIGKDPGLVVSACAGRVALLNELYVLARDRVRREVDPVERKEAIARATTLQRLIDQAMHGTESGGRG